MSKLNLRYTIRPGNLSESGGVPRFQGPLQLGCCHPKVILGPKHRRYLGSKAPTPDVGYPPDHNKNRLLDLGFSSLMVPQKN